MWTLICLGLGAALLGSSLGLSTWDTMAWVRAIAGLTAMLIAGWYHEQKMANTFARTTAFTLRAISHLTIGNPIRIEAIGGDITLIWGDDAVKNSPNKFNDPWECLVYAHLRHDYIEVTGDKATVIIRPQR